jgi:succinate dehydrogenase flavin-adding protein (antitoxin of CptAB toxin-antitoxin module)
VERARLLAKIQERLERRRDKSLESYIRAYERAHAKEMSVSELQELNVILSQTDESLVSWLVRVGLMRQISPHQ